MELPEGVVEIDSTGGWAGLEMSSIGPAKVGAINGTIARARSKNPVTFNFECMKNCGRNILDAFIE